MRGDFLLEIGTEEIPFSYLESANHQLTQMLRQYLDENKLTFDHITEKLYTPRRLSVHIQNLDLEQRDFEEEIKGPPVQVAYRDGISTPAFQAFLKKNEIRESDVEKRDLGKKGIYLFARKKIKGQPTHVLLANLLPELILKLSFPKSMVWEKTKAKFARPIRWIVALLNHELISFQVASVQSGRMTRGHRILGKSSLEIKTSNLNEYINLLKDQFVYVDKEERKQKIEQLIQQIEKENHWVVDLSVLEEVSNLVEYPNATLAEFSEEFLNLPIEVVHTAIQKHQKYFPIQDQHENLVRKFVVVFNHEDSVSKNVKLGAEKIIKARLADAEFFWKEDLKKVKKDLSKEVEKINQAVFQEKIGTYGDKIRRIKIWLKSLEYPKGETVETKIVSVPFEKINIPDFEKEQFTLTSLHRAADLLKFDLMSQMVYEFPNLQGIMGSYYAEENGENPVVCHAIKEHYMPRFSQDEIPLTVSGKLLALADKVDTIVSCFWAGLAPTGSQDPYALRRQSLGVLRILEHEGFNNNLSLDHCLEYSVEALSQTFSHELSQTEKNQLIDSVKRFMLERLKNLWKSKGIAYDLFDVIEPMIQKQKYCRVSIYFNTILFWKDLKESWEDLPQLVQVIERLKNITQSLDEIKEIKPIEPKPIEKELYECFINNKQDLENQLYKLKADKSDFVKSYHQIFSEVINQYFDEIMVMDKNKDIRERRLSLLKSIYELFHSEHLGDITRLIM